MFALNGVDMHAGVEEPPVIPPPLPNPRPYQPSRTFLRRKKNRNHRRQGNILPHHLQPQQAAGGQEELAQQAAGGQEELAQLAAADEEELAQLAVADEEELAAADEEELAQLAAADEEELAAADEEELAAADEEELAQLAAADEEELAQAEEDQPDMLYYHGKSLHNKLGNYYGATSETDIADILRFESTKSGSDGTSLKDYVTRMKEGQNDIYYITGESKKAVENSPFIERLKKKGLEVLYIVDALDEYSICQLKEFEGKKLVSATKEGLKLDVSEDEKKRKEELKEMLDGLCKVIKEVLGDRIEKAIVSDQMVHSPCCIFTGEYGCTANMEKIMKAQAPMDSSMGVYMSSKKTMGINPENSIIEELCKRADADRNDLLVKDLVMLLFETSLLTSGFSLDDPNAFCTRIHRMLKLGLDIDEDKTGEADDNNMPPLED